MSRAIGAKKYTPDILAEASKLVQSGSITLNAAARSYGIPKTTLHDKVKGKYATNRTGPRTVLTDEEESRLAQWVVQMARIGFGRTRQELFQTVKKILDEDGRKSPFKNNKPGKDWYKGFIRRHPEISEKAPMQLGKERAVITPAKIENWFKELRDFIENEVKDQDLMTDPTRLYNADESGFPLCPKSGKVLSMKGAKHVYNYTSSNKTQMTVLACVSAVGHYIRPLIVYPGERFRTNVLEGFEEAAIGRSVNGWMDSELFLTWLKEVFIPGIDERNIRRPVLLFVDGHSTHLTLEASDLCRENGVHMFCLLEHASHIIQPLDLRIFGVLKEKWGQAVRNYQIENIPNTVTKRTFAQVFKGAWDKSATVENAIKAFKYAGLFPLDETVVLKTAKMQPSRVFLKSPPDTCDSQAVTCYARNTSASRDSFRTPQGTDSEESLETSHGTASTEDVEANKDTASAADVPVTKLKTWPNETFNPGTDVQSASAVEPAVEALATLSSISFTADETTVQPSVASVTFSTASSSNVAQAIASSPFSKHLALPSAPSSKNPKTKRKFFPKAITGEAFRKILVERKEQKDKLEKEKQKRKEDRELRKKEKEAQRQQKQKEREEKKRKREEEKERIKKEKNLKQLLLVVSKRRRTESSSSDSSINYQPNDDSDFDIDIDTRKCYKCGVPYDDNEPLSWIACNTCPRLFHRGCTDVPFHEMSEEDVVMFPFECLYC